MEVSHRLGVGDVSRVLVAVAVKNLDGAHVRLLAIRSGAGDTTVARVCKSFQRGSCLSHVLFHPDGMVECHRLAPVRECEARVRLLRLAKPPRGIFVFKIVKLRETGEEGLLCGGSARVCKGHGADACGWRNDRYLQD